MPIGTQSLGRRRAAQAMSRMTGRERDSTPINRMRGPARSLTCHHVCYRHAAVGVASPFMPIGTQSLVRRKAAQGMSIATRRHRRSTPMSPKRGPDVPSSMLQACAVGVASPSMPIGTQSLGRRRATQAMSRMTGRERGSTPINRMRGPARSLTCHHVCYRHAAVRVASPSMP